MHRIFTSRTSYPGKGLDQKLDSASIYNALKNKIIRLELPPERVLNISELAQKFGVSRTPIKEILISLQAEEWVQRNGSHFVVTPLSLERIREVTEIRMVMEVQANIWAMERISPEEAKELARIRHQMESFDADRPNVDIVDLDFQFHRFIFKIAKNAQLAKMLEWVLSHYLRFWLSIPRQIDTTEFFVEALELIHAIDARDPDRVRDCTIRHIRHSVSEIMGTR
jgi:DNA-binding GntR family transcriptional regulator